MNVARRAVPWALAASVVDTHMGALLGSPGLLETYRRLGRDYGVPVLLERGGDRPAGASVPEGEALVDRVLGIEPGVHLAYDDEEMRGATWDHPDYGAAWRQADFDMVRSPGFQDFLKKQGFVLVSWRDLAKARNR